MPYLAFIRRCNRLDENEMADKEIRWLRGRILLLLKLAGNPVIFFRKEPDVLALFYLI